MKSNDNIIECCNNTHQGVPHTGKQTFACALDLGDNQSRYLSQRNHDTPLFINAARAIVHSHTKLPSHHYKYTANVGFVVQLKLNILLFFVQPRMILYRNSSSQRVYNFSFMVPVDRGCMISS